MKPRSKLLQTVVPVFAALLLTPATATAYAQDEPAQPLAEVEIVERFQEEADALFLAWLVDRPERLKRAGLGKQGQVATAACTSSKKGSNFFEFIECEDVEPPTNYSIDVVRTDSLLSPFVGLIAVPVTERCNLRRAYGGPGMSRKKFDELMPHCIGKSYGACISAGGRLVGKTVSSACTGGPGGLFSYEGKATLTYRWSKGKWEFDEEELKPSRDPGGAKNK